MCECLPACLYGHCMHARCLQRPEEACELQMYPGSYGWWSPAQWINPTEGGLAEGHSLCDPPTPALSLFLPCPLSSSFLVAMVSSFLCCILQCDDILPHLRPKTLGLKPLKPQARRGLPFFMSFIFLSQQLITNTVPYNIILKTVLCISKSSQTK